MQQRQKPRRDANLPFRLSIMSSLLDAPSCFRRPLLPPSAASALDECHQVSAKLLLVRGRQARRSTWINPQDGSLDKL
jgi:hypothetical protein